MSPFPDHEYEKGYTETIHISKREKKLFLNDCYQEYLKNNPHRKGQKITQNEVFASMRAFYLQV